MVAGKVLILDHDSPWSRFVAETLSAHGYEPIIVERLPEALTLLEETAREDENYLVFVDSYYGRAEDHPKVKLLEVAKTIAERFPKVPLVVMSSRYTPDEAVLTYEIGASAYIRKTFDENRLIESVEKVIQRAHSYS